MIDYPKLFFYCEHNINQELGKKTDYTVKKFDNPLKEKIFVIESNLRRRHLTSYQKTELGMKLEPLEAGLAKKRMSEAGKVGRDIQLGVGSIDHTPGLGKTRDIVAKKVGLSPKTYERGKKVIEKAPKELKKWVEDGDWSISGAYNEINSKKGIERITKVLTDGVSVILQVIR